MADVKINNNSKVQISKRKIFQIFLKTGKKRILLSTLSGIIVFITITSLCFVLYNYRFNTFQNYTAEIDWMNDGIISAKSNHPVAGRMEFKANFFNNFTDHYVQDLEQLFPNLHITNASSVMSAQTYYYTANPDNPWLYYEFMVVPDNIYSILNNSLIEGRMPRNDTELLYRKNDIAHFENNDSALIYDYQSPYAPTRNYTIVGVLGNLTDLFVENGFSNDLLDWQFDRAGFDNYWEYAMFLFNFTTFREILNSRIYYHGIINYLVDVSYDCSAMQINKFVDYVEQYPTESFLESSDITFSNVLLAEDLKPLFVNFNDYWTDIYVKIIGINSPLILILGLLTFVTLNIGSKELGTTFRRLKLYGLSYKTIRTMIIQENLIFTFISFLTGTSIGLAIGAILSMNIPDKSDIHMNLFLTDQLFIMFTVTFILGFFGLSYLIQNSIAKNTAKTAHEEYRKKRRKIRALFSTNEFRLFIFAFAFSLISVLLYILYYFVGPTVEVFASFSYYTLFMFMITISIAFIATFAFLMIARLFTSLWTLVSRRFAGNIMNQFTVSLKHLTDSRNIYQITILASLVFGLIALPGISMKLSIPQQTAIESTLGTSYSDLVITKWIDPENDKDIIFDNITEIVNHTDVYRYRIIESNLNQRYQNPFEINALAIDEPLVYADILRGTDFEEDICSVDHIESLTTMPKIFIDTAFAKKKDLESGSWYNTSLYTKTTMEFLIEETFDFFPLTGVPQISIFQNIEQFSIVGSRQTIREFTRKIDFSTTIYSESVKIIKVVNESAIPYVQELLQNQSITTKTYKQYYQQFLDNVDEFPSKNLLFFTFMAGFTLVVIGYFSGIRIYDDRLRIISLLYREGAQRKQILLQFSSELILVMLIPLIIAIGLSFPLINYLAVDYLGVQENFVAFSPRIPFWMTLVAILGGLILMTVGWFAALTPAVYRYRPIKQE